MSREILFLFTFFNDFVIGLPLIPYDGGLPLVPYDGLIVFFCFLTFLAGDLDCLVFVIL
jgi:hypothetical protein